MKFKVALYGFGSGPVIFRHLIELMADGVGAVSWALILPLPNHRSLLEPYINQRDTLDVYKELPAVPKGIDPTVLAGYPGNIFEDLAAQKRQWRRLPGGWLVRRAQDYYDLYKSFLLRTRCTHVLALSVETPDAKILIAAARELGLGVMAATDLRNLTGTMFACDAVETPPMHGQPSQAHFRAAEKFVKEFRRQWYPPRNIPLEIEAAADDNELMASFAQPLLRRISGFVRNWQERPDMFDPVNIRDSIMPSSPMLQKLVWGTRARINGPKYHLEDEQDLPKRFVFYPLQYTPESSINVPAPYFVDQMRVIDAIRFAIPSDHLLVVKEHRSCLPMRPIWFMPAVMKLPGVCVAKYSMPARCLVQNASATVTVTGTAGFEAFLAGHKSIALGPGLTAWALGGVTPLGELQQAFQSRNEEVTSAQNVIERIARLFAVRYPFFHGSAGMLGEPVLRRGNLIRFTESVYAHLERDRARNSLN